MTQITLQILMRINSGEMILMVKNGTNVRKSQTIMTSKKPIRMILMATWMNKLLCLRLPQLVPNFNNLNKQVKFSKINYFLPISFL